LEPLKERYPKDAFVVAVDADKMLIANFLDNFSSPPEICSVIFEPTTPKEPTPSSLNADD
jgi:hypothetical protein